MTMRKGGRWRHAGPGRLGGVATDLDSASDALALGAVRPFRL